MADIDVERKSPIVWIWVLLALVVLGLLLFWLLAGPGRDQMAAVDPAMEPAPPPAPVEPAPTTGEARVQEYLQDCAPREPTEMAVEHQYTVTCLRNLLAAMEESFPPEQLAGVQAEMDGARNAAERLEQSPPDALEHSATIRNGFTSVAAAFERLQRQWYPRLEQPVRELTRRAEAVDPAEPLLEQRAEVQGFFVQAGDALNRTAGIR